MANNKKGMHYQFANLNILILKTYTDPDYLHNTIINESV